MSDLSLYQLRSANLERAHEWRGGKLASSVPLSFSMNELTGEVGELANMIKKVERQTFGLKGGKPYAELEGEIVDELADVLICVDLLGMKLGVDLASAVRAKFNKTSDKYELRVKL